MSEPQNVIKKEFHLIEVDYLDKNQKAFHYFEDELIDFDQLMELLEASTQQYITAAKELKIVIIDEKNNIRKV